MRVYNIIVIIKYSKSRKNVKLWRFFLNHAELSNISNMKFNSDDTNKYMIIPIVYKKTFIKHTLIECNTKRSLN